MKFYFCNFLGTEINRQSKVGKQVLFSDCFQGRVQEAKMLFKDNNIHFVEPGDNSEGEIDVFENLSCELVGSSYEELKSTEENPIIMVATKSFKVVSGVPAYIKYIPVFGGTLVALIKGYIEVEGPDGSRVPLSRNVTMGYVDTSSSNSKVFGWADVYDMNILKDTDSDVSFNNYVVSDCLISLTKSKDGNFCQKVKYNKDCFTIFDNSVFEEGKRKKEEAIIRKQQEKEEKERQKALFEKRMLEKQMQEELEAKNKVKSPKRSQSTSSKKPEVVSGSEGAAMFLNFVNSVKK